MNDISDDSYTSDEDETTPMYGGNTKPIPESKLWDVFRNPPPQLSSASMDNRKRLSTATKILKVVVYFITFITVLGCGVLIKGITLFMTSQIRKGKEVIYCNKGLGGVKQFKAVLPEEERVLWMWCLFIAYAVPELGSFFRSSRMCFFKSVHKPNLAEFFIVFIMETFHTIGLAMLFYIILPNIDVLKGAMLTNAVCFVPCLLIILSRKRREKWHSFKMIIDIIALSIQATAFFVWPLLEGQQKPELWLIPISLLFVSCGWWENYVSASKDSALGIVKPLEKIMARLQETRYFTYMFVSIWKIVCFFCSILVISLAQNQGVGSFFTLLPAAFGPHKINVTEVISASSSALSSGALANQETYLMDTYYLSAVWVTIIHIFAGYLCYIFGKFACRIMIQSFSFAFPINLTVPVTICVLIAFCGARIRDQCAFHYSIPDYLFFDSPDIYSLADFIYNQHSWIWLLWLLSQSWITLHLWRPKSERLASTEKVFVTPMYNSLLIDQSLAMNRRRHDKLQYVAEIFHDEDSPLNSPRPSIASNKSSAGNIKPSDYHTRIFACATMWHETREEMLEMLKSIFRMDSDQSARRIAQKYLHVDDPDYYEFETHIFFDDAFERTPERESIVNSYVKMLVSVMDEAATLVHETRVRIRAPMKYPTPYGGRLVWTLPGKTKLYAHLKDKNKIRHRKRWSQVMYMYYLLGHRLMELPISVDRKAIIAQNTYILALDGDIDFQPPAVLILIDLMKKNQNLGAACGRIHPVGSGPMQWYQVFEYAIGHWLQKATEHMIGCVLCSPGCFSLFRGKALMDDCVMNKYTTQSVEARHYVQFDQGEDRWLCTLLLQRGYRVEYSAASDAYTHCPEGFQEFYNQRRRWIPSTTANIMDLLLDYKRTINVNDNISFPYIIYQVVLMGGTILGPGTIFLMLVGAFVAAFKIDNWTSFQYNIIPILVFMFVCFLFKENVQMPMAMIISTLYGLVMMAVLVGIMLQIEEDGVLAPSSLFLFIVAGEMILTGLFHPQEVFCLPAGIIYYITIPSMYLLLIIYSIFNLNNVTWGTREVKAVLTKQEEEEKRLLEEAAKKKKKGIFGQFQTIFGKKDTYEDEGSIEFSLAGLFKCMLCTRPKSLTEQHQLANIGNSLDALSRRLDSLERHLLDSSSPMRRRNTIARDLPVLAENIDETEEEGNETNDDDYSEGTTPEPKQTRDDNVNPYWIEDRKLKRGDVDYILTSEKQFWMDVIDKYLHPIDENEVEKAKIARDLKNLRNLCVFAFFMLNALFVLVVFLLQQSKEMIHIEWPLGAKTNVTFIDDSSEVHVTKKYLQLEPIGLVFLLFYGIVLVVQFTAMLFHRLSTMAHILAYTELNWKLCGKEDDLTDEAVIQKNFMQIAYELQKLPREADDENAKKQPGNRNTIHNLVLGRSSSVKNTQKLSSAFKEKLSTLGEGEEGAAKLAKRTTLHRDTFMAVARRTTTVFNDQRKSQTHLGRTSSVRFADQASSRSTSTPSVPSLPEHMEMTGGYFNGGLDSTFDDDGIHRRSLSNTRSSLQSHNSLHAPN